MNDSLLKASIAEFLGTFTLVFIGAAAVTVAGEQGLVVPALGHGLILVGIILAYGRISGAHVNPAVTLGLLLGRQITIDRAVFYWVAQFLGGVVAALVLRLLLPDSVVLPSPDVVNIGEAVGTLTDTEVWRAAAFEFVLTFFLVSAVYQAAVFGKLNNLEALAIGLTLAGAIFAGGVYTGASLNPARTLGPALVAGNLNYVVPYMVGQFLAGALGGLLHMALYRPDAEAERT